MSARTEHMADDGVTYEMMNTSSAFDWGDSEDTKAEPPEPREFTTEELLEEMKKKK